MYAARECTDPQPRPVVALKRLPVLLDAVPSVARLSWERLRLLKPLRVSDDDDNDDGWATKAVGNVNSTFLILGRWHFGRAWTVQLNCNRSICFHCQAKEERCVPNVNVKSPITPRTVVRSVNQQSKTTNYA